ncbi:MAG: hypothetical protein BWX58_01119 [Deltaproteobacteria bacterium ADurb.Bin026]|nr:MAG: hypothetical protein BWX58_01119 [Deltaproteobacteria bacterium ADurb.Bin026]
MYAVRPFVEATSAIKIIAKTSLGQYGFKYLSSLR